MDSTQLDKVFNAYEEARDFLIKKAELMAPVLGEADLAAHNFESMSMDERGYVLGFEVYRCGDTDYSSVLIKREWIEDPKWLEKVVQERNEERAKEKERAEQRLRDTLKEKEERERAEYEKLKAKFSP